MFCINKKYYCRVFFIILFLIIFLINNSMNLTTTPFTDLEKRKQYKICTFTEMGVCLNVLNELPLRQKIPSGSFYKFGVIRNGNYFWFFNSVPIANERQQMLEFYSAITSVLKQSNDIPFVFKVKKI